MKIDSLMYLILLKDIYRVEKLATLPVTGFLVSTSNGAGVSKADCQTIDKFSWVNLSWACQHLDFRIWDAKCVKNLISCFVSVILSAEVSFVVFFHWHYLSGGVNMAEAEHRGSHSTFRHFTHQLLNKWLKLFHIFNI